MERVVHVDLVQLDLDGQHLHDAEEVEHEAVAGERALLHLDLRALLVVAEQGSKKGEHGVAAARVRQDVVEGLVEEDAGVL